MTAADIRAALSNLDTFPPLERLREIRKLERALRWLEASGIAERLPRLLLGLNPRHRPKPSGIRAMLRFTARMVTTTRVGVTTPEHHLSRRRKALRT